ncbi:MAG: hypothetical protein LBK68_03090 [Candidatus Margulisbacteria bacterium]|jgi:hypothetical protein|nr:hypothetical protein [Candidatus Margulisiibacteriota bacterium]
MDLREASRRCWTDENYNNNSSLTLGCMLRIADAIEIVAKNYTSLLREIESLRDQKQNLNIQLSKEIRRTAAYRGIIKKRR